MNDENLILLEHISKINHYTTSYHHNRRHEVEDGLQETDKINAMLMVQVESLVDPVNQLVERVQFLEKAPRTVQPAQVPYGLAVRYLPNAGGYG